MTIDKNRFKIQNGKLFIDGMLTSVPSISSFVSIKGAGEKGVVFFAVDNLSRPVAVKIWMQSSDYSEDAYKEGLKEATRLASLEHPNILQVLYAGADNHKRFYSVMKRLEGQTLREYLRNARSLEDRYILWFDIARAMSFAHERGIYHGDLHLGNMSVENGRAKVFDFGASMSTRSFFREIEGSQLEHLAKILFPEFDDEVLCTVPTSLYCSEFRLCQLVAWITLEGHYLALKQTLKYHPDEEYLRQNFIFQISIYMEQAPVFNIDRVLDRFSILPHSADDDRLDVRWLLAHLFAECNRRLSGGRGSIEISVRPSFEKLKIMIKDPWTKWQREFLSMKCKSFSEVTRELRYNRKLWMDG